MVKLDDFKIPENQIPNGLIEPENCYWFYKFENIVKPILIVNLAYSYNQNEN